MGSSTDPGFRIDTADWERDGDDLRSVRKVVFIDEQRVPPDMEWDGEDGASLHLLARDYRGRPIGTARLMPSGQIGRMAVLPAWRGRGVGRALLERMLREVDGRGVARPFLHAQQTAVAFYERFGFVCQGKPFDEAGIPHRSMARQTAGESVLGVTEGIQRLAGLESQRAAIDLMMEQAERHLCLLTTNLEGPLYDRRPVVDAVRRLALRHPERLPVRILVLDPGVSVRRGHRLIELSRHLSSAIEMRTPADEQDDLEQLFLLVDDAGWVERRPVDEEAMVADFSDALGVRHRLHLFDGLWERAHPPLELRRLHL